MKTAIINFLKKQDVDTNFIKKAIDYLEYHCEPKYQPPRMPPDTPSEIKISTWWSNGGGMMYNRRLLPGDHPENLYNWVKRELKVEPEWYGIEKPFSTSESYPCPECGRSCKCL